MMEHQDEWINEAENIIQELKGLLGDAAVDIQHIGSTAIPSIHANPIIDTVTGVRELNDVQPYIDGLQKKHCYMMIASGGWPFGFHRTAHVIRKENES